MKKRPQGVLAVFDHTEAVVDAIRALRKSGRRKFSVLSPMPNPAIAEELEHEPSPVRLFTFVGGLVGGILGFLLCAWTSLDWPLVTNGKEIVSYPPFMVITFECTVLIGGITNLIAMLFFTGLTAGPPDEGFDPRFTEDRYGIWVSCGRDEAESIAGTLRGAGAEEVRVEAA